MLHAPFTKTLLRFINWPKPHFNRDARGTSERGAGTAQWGSRDDAVVRALASHQCVPNSVPGVGVICGLSLFLVVYSAPGAFSPGTPVFPSPGLKNQHFQILIRSWNARTFLKPVLVNSLVLRLSTIPYFSVRS